LVFFKDFRMTVNTINLPFEFMILKSSLTLLDEFSPKFQDRDDKPMTFIRYFLKQSYADIMNLWKNLFSSLTEVAGFNQASRKDTSES